MVNDQSSSITRPAVVGSSIQNRYQSLFQQWPNPIYCHLLLAFTPRDVFRATAKTGNFCSSSKRRGSSSSSSDGTAPQLRRHCFTCVKSCPNFPASASVPLVLVSQPSSTTILEQYDTISQPSQHYTIADFILNCVVSAPPLDCFASSLIVTAALSHPFWFRSTRLVCINMVRRRSTPS